MDFGGMGRLRQGAFIGYGYRLPVGQKRDCMGGRGRFLPVFGLPTRFAFAHEPDGAGGSVFTIDLWVSAFQARLTQVDLMLHADVWGLTIRMVDTRSHAEALLNGRKMTCRYQVSRPIVAVPFRACHYFEAR